MAKVSPDILQIIYLDELCGRMEELSEKLGASATFKGPMTKMFKWGSQYQYATVQPGRYKRVWFKRNPQPERLVGIITQVANQWYPNTHLEWIIDYDSKLVEYEIGLFCAPKEFERGIPFHEEVEWIAHNDSAVEHTFGVLMEGFFLSKKLFNKIVR